MLYTALLALYLEPIMGAGHPAETGVGRPCDPVDRIPECKGLGAHLLISTIKPVVRYLQYAYIYVKQEPHGPLFTKEAAICACAAAKQTGIPLEF